MGLKQQVFHGVKWNVVSVVYKTIIQLARISILARFISMTDFGLIAVALMLVSFTEIFVDLGFTVPIIHKQDITKKEYSSVFWMNVIMGVFIYLSLFFCAPMISRFYEDNALTNIVRILCSVIIINAFGKVFQTIRTKNLDFKFISIVSIISSSIGLLTIWLLAIMGFGIYSLVYGTIIETIIRQGIFFIKGLNSNNISFYFNVIEIKDYFRIGGYQIGSQLMDFIANKIDIIIIGKLVGMENLGIYNLAKELIMKCYGLGVALTRSVFMAALAKVQNMMDKYRVVYAQYVEKFSFFSIGVFMALFFMADVVCDIMYGAKAGDIIPVFRMLVLYGIMVSLVSPMASVELSLGRTDIALVWTSVISLLSLLVIMVGSIWNLDGIIVGETVLSIICVFLCWRIVLSKLLKIDFKEFLSPYIKPIIYVFPSGLVGLSIMFMINGRLSGGLVSGIVFVLLYYYLVIKNDALIRQQFCGIFNRIK